MVWTAEKLHLALASIVLGVLGCGDDAGSAAQNGATWPSSPTPSSSIGSGTPAAVLGAQPVAGGPPLVAPPAKDEGNLWSDFSTTEIYSVATGRAIKEVASIDVKVKVAPTRDGNSFVRATYGDTGTRLELVDTQSGAVVDNLVRMGSGDLRYIKPSPRVREQNLHFLLTIREIDEDSARFEYAFFDFQTFRFAQSSAAKRIPAPSSSAWARCATWNTTSCARMAGCCRCSSAR